MAGAILVCGPIGCGKTTYAAELCRQRGMALLSMDEVMLTVVGPDAGELHELYAARTEKLLLTQALRLLGDGIGVVLDWGPWRREKRDCLKNFFESSGFSCELHWILPEEKEWHRRIERRNAAVKTGEVCAYPVDEGLMQKFLSRWEGPAPEEIHCLIQ